MKTKSKFFNSLARSWNLSGYDYRSTACFEVIVDDIGLVAKVTLIAGDGECYIHEIIVEHVHRGNGYLHHVLRELVAHADHHRLKLSLLVADFDDIIGEPKLIEVYGRYHFSVVKQSAESGETEMLRHPR